MFIKVEHRYIGVVGKNHTRNDFIADLKIFTRAVFSDVLAHFDDFARSFVSEYYGDKSERISLEFVSVGAAYAATFYLYENVVVAEFGNLIFLKFESLFFHEHGDSRFFGNRTRRTRSRNRRFAAHVA